MNVEQLVAGDPRDAAVRHLRVRDQLLRVVTTSAEANDLVTETFYPDGMLGVFEAPSRHDPDLTVVDLTCDASDIQELLRRESRTAARGSSNSPAASGCLGTTPPPARCSRCAT